MFNFSWKKAIIDAIVILTGAIAITWLIFAVCSGPKTIELDEKHFKCTDTQSKGIEAVCTQYTMVAWLK